MFPIAQVKREQEHPLAAFAGISDYFQLAGMGPPFFNGLPALNSPKIRQFPAKVMLEFPRCFQGFQPVSPAGWEQIPNDNLPAAPL